MLARGSGRVNLIPDTNMAISSFTKENYTKRVSGGDRMRFVTSCGGFRVPRRLELSPVKFLKRLGDKVAAALQFVSGRRTRRYSPNDKTLGKSNPSIALVDSQRAEAIGDCIEFIKSCSSFQRSNSVSTSSC